MKQSIKALALFSGGLDSLLSIKLMREQGIEVEALFFDIGFYSKMKEKREYLCEAIKQVDAELTILDIREQFHKEILFSPKYGYGKHLNPCIDCHANMFRWAHSLMEQKRASFLVSGEVLGQRPKSQRSIALRQVQELAGASGLILRPLSAKRLPITIPEESGWVDRDRLLDITGRDRSRQMALAKGYGLTLFESPGGGCLLTNEEFSDRVEHFQESTPSALDFEALKHGRYFVLSSGARLIVARNEGENYGLLDACSPNFYMLDMDELIGPVALLQRSATLDEKREALKILITYSRHEKDRVYTLAIGDDEISESALTSKEEAKRYMLESR